MNPLSSALSALLNGSLLRAAALDALAVVSPTDCSGCGLPDRALCLSCAAALQARPILVEVGEETTAFPVSCAVDYRGVVRNVLLAYKESGRTDAAPALARALAAALREMLDGAALDGASSDGVELATIPSTRAAFRTRGYHPTELLLSHAGMRASRVLKAARQTEDQASLGANARAANRFGSLISARELAGRSFVIVDDIVTTGATLREARRAILAAGGRVCGAATLAHTARENPAC